MLHGANLSLCHQVCLNKSSLLILITVGEPEGGREYSVVLGLNPYYYAVLRAHIRRFASGRWCSSQSGDIWLVCFFCISTEAV